MEIRLIDDAKHGIGLVRADELFDTGDDGVAEEYYQVCGKHIAVLSSGPAGSKEFPVLSDTVICQCHGRMETDLRIPGS